MQGQHPHRYTLTHEFFSKLTHFLPNFYYSFVQFSDAVAFSNAHFGAGTGYQLLDGVACSGTESTLISCSSSSTIYCSNGHNGDAGVRCQGQLD